MEVRFGSRLTDEQLRRLRERLAGCAAQLVVEEDGGRLGYRVQAEVLAEAVAEALSRLGGQLPILRLSLMTPEEIEREQPPVPELVGIVEIQELAGLASKQRAFQVAKLPGFPAPAHETRAGASGHGPASRTSSAAGRAAPVDLGERALRSPSP